MTIKINKTNFLFILLLYIINILFAFFIGNIDELNMENYIFLILVFFVAISIFGFTLIYKTIDFFSPYFMVSLISFIFFFISPLIDYQTKNFYFFGIDSRVGLVKGTLCFIFGYFVYSVFIIIFTSRIKEWSYKGFSIEKGPGVHKIVFFNLILWVALFMVSSINLIRSSLVSTTLGLGDGQITNSIGVFSILGYGLIVPWMYIIIFSKGKLIKVLLTILTGILYFLNGYRFILIIMLLAPLSFYYIKSGKRPTLTQIITLLFLGSVFLAFVGFARNFMRLGNSIDYHTFSLDQILYTFQSNFGIYKAFYIMVDRIPKEIDYTYGSQIMYTFILFIPRIFWLGKPDTPMRALIYPLLGNYALVAGTAWPNIGEYYSEFGLIGVAIGYIFFAFLSFLVMYYMRKNSSIDIKILCSIIYGTFFQLIIRGYTPTNFWLIFTFIIFVYINILWRKHILKIEGVRCINIG